MPALGAWSPTAQAPAFDPATIQALIAQVREPLHVIQDRRTGHVGLAQGGQVQLEARAGQRDAAYALLGSFPALYPEWLGERSFLETHQVRFAYVAGAMANGIATAELVIAMARAGMLAFFGAAGLGYEKVERGLDTILAQLGTRGPSWGANLIHSPQEPVLEERVAQLFIERGVKRVEASAFMKLTPAIVRYAYHGLRVDAQGRIERPHHVFAKISRTETATHFMSPAPKAMLDELVRQGKLTAQEANLALRLPVAQDITAEADSGGHTDNRPLTVLLPEIRALALKLQRHHGYAQPLRVGVGGGLGTPDAVAAAFAAGAAYVLTGSVNQSALESGLSSEGKAMLALAGLADVIMAPAADMFELGVEVQVLKRGTMFGPRAKKLHDLYTRYASLEDIPEAQREQLEQRVLGATLDEVWQQTEQFWSKRDPAEVERAQRDPRHRMALVFRWYLGKASKWAIDGEPGRALDYQIWCGPAMGAFNTWVQGSFLEDPSQRHVSQIALNMLEGAACITRAHQLRTYGLPVPAEAFHFTPRYLR